MNAPVVVTAKSWKRLIPVALSLGIAVVIVIFVLAARFADDELLMGRHVAVPLADVDEKSIVLLLADKSTATELDGDGTLESVLAGLSGWNMQRVPVDGFSVASGRSVGAVIESLPDDKDVQLVIVQAGKSDEWIVNAGLRDDAVSAIHEAREKYPSAQILLVGPVPSGASSIRQTGIVDIALTRAAEEAGASYLSPLAGQWYGAASVEMPPAVSGLPMSEAELRLMAMRIFEQIGGI